MGGRSIDSTTGRAGQVLVTGGCGFIGANTVKMLVARGHAVRVFDNFSVPPGDHLAGVPLHSLVEGDIRDMSAVQRAMEGCTHVVHLAALTSVLDSVRDPAASYDVNVGGTLSVLRGAVAAGVRHVVFASSNASLGEQNPPLDETCIPRPISPYGASKLAGEGYCSAFAGSYGLRAVVLRFGNAYGPYCEHKTSVIAKYLRSLLAGDSLQIYGDGRQTRDFVSAADAARAISLAVERDNASGVFQIATGQETSILELIDALNRVTGITPTLEWLPEQAGEIRRNFVSIEKARRVLGYEPTLTLEEGLATTLTWLAGNAGPRLA